MDDYLSRLDALLQECAESPASARISLPAPVPPVPARRGRRSLYPHGVFDSRAGHRVQG